MTTSSRGQGQGHRGGSLPAVEIGEANRIPGELGRLWRVKACYHVDQQMNVSRMYVLGLGTNDGHQPVIEQQEAEENVFYGSDLLSDHAGYLVARVLGQRVRVDAVEPHAVVVVGARDDVGEQFLGARELVAQVEVVVSSEDLLDERESDHAQYLVVGVEELRFELLEAGMSFTGHAHEDQMTLVQENELVVTGFHVFELILVVTLDNGYECLQQTHEGDELHFIAMSWSGQTALGQFKAMAPSSGQNAVLTVNRWVFLLRSV